MSTETPGPVRKDGPTARNARDITKLAVNRTARHLARSGARKVPLGLGAAVGGALVAKDMRKARKAETIAKDESRPEAERIKAEREMESALRSASLGALSTTLGTAPGLGTAAAIAVDAVEFAAEAIDIVEEARGQGAEGPSSQSMQRALAVAEKAAQAAQGLEEKTRRHSGGRRP